MAGGAAQGEVGSGRYPVRFPPRADGLLFSTKKNKTYTHEKNLFLATFARIQPRLCMQIRLGELFLPHQVSPKKDETEGVS